MTTPVASLTVEAIAEAARLATEARKTAQAACTWCEAGVARPSDPCTCETRCQYVQCTLSEMYSNAGGLLVWPLDISRFVPTPEFLRDSPPTT